MTEINGDKIEFVELPDCEHCGEGHESFGVQIHDGNTHWCLDCYRCDNKVTDEQLDTIRELELRETIGWHQREVWRLEKELKNLYE